MVAKRRFKVVPPVRVSNEALSAQIDVIGERVAGIGGRVDGIDGVLKKLADSVVELALLEQRMASHKLTDDAVAAVVASQGVEIVNLKLATAPLTEMRKYFLLGIWGLFGLLITSGVNMGVNWISKQEAAAASTRVERVLAAPQEDRKAIVEEAKK